MDRNQFSDPTRSSFHNTDIIAIRRAEMQIINELKQQIISQGKESGELECPKCNGKINYKFIPELNKVEMHCESEGCINIDETEVT